MAIFEAFDVLDLRKFDLGKMFRNAFDYWVDDQPYTVDDNTYPMGFILQVDEAFTETLEFYGHGLTVAEGGAGFTAGRFVAYASWWKDTGENQWYRDYNFSGFNISASSLIDAMATLSLLDDRAVTTRMLAGDDTVTLWRSNDWFDGKAGNDTLRGNGGDDTLLGNAGNDLIFGGAGNDSLSGNAGNDTLTGGVGEDVFVISDGGGRDVVTDFTDGSDHLRFSNGATQFGQLFITDTGADVRIAHGGEIVILRGIEPGVLDAADFLFG